MEIGSSVWAALGAGLCLLGSALLTRQSAKNAAEASRCAERARGEDGADIRRALEIAAQGVCAAHDGISAVRTLAEISQRAYLAFDSLDIVHRDPASGLPMLVRGEVRNGGNTPARSVVTCQWLRYLRDLPVEPEYSGLETVAGTVIGPGGGERVDASAPHLDAGLAQDVKRRKLIIFVYGVTRYEDLFGGVQQTRWAFYWSVERQQFLRFPRHNDMT